MAVGPVLIVLALVLVIPIATMIGCAVLAGVLGWLVKTDVDQAHEGSELLALDR